MHKLWQTIWKEERKEIESVTKTSIHQKHKAGVFL